MKINFRFPWSKGAPPSTPLPSDVINRPGSIYSGAISKHKVPGNSTGCAWYLPDATKWAMMQDAQVFAAVMIWKMGVLIDGYKISPAVDPGDPRYKRAKEISDFCNYCAENMRGSFHMKMLQLLDASISGHKAASQVYKEQKQGKYKGKIVIDYLRIIPNSHYQIRVDDFGVPLGLQEVGAQNEEKIFSMRKFLFVSFRPFDDNPLGTNILWPVYDAWWQKKRIVPERLAHMEMFGSPSLWAEAPENIRDADLLDRDNNPVKDPTTGLPIKVPLVRAMLKALEGFRGNGSATVLPNGSKLNMIQAQGNGEAFRFYQGDVNAEIIKGILWSTLMTESGANQSRASSQTGEGTVQMTIADGKFMLQDLIKEQFCENLVMLNWREKDWDLVPRVAFGDNQKNITSLFNAISALWSVGFFDDSQRSALCHLLGLPDPDPEAPRNNAPRDSAGGALKFDPANPDKSAQPETTPEQKPEAPPEEKGAPSN